MLLNLLKRLLKILFPHLFVRNDLVILNEQLDMVEDVLLLVSADEAYGETTGVLSVH